MVANPISFDASPSHNAVNNASNDQWLKNLPLGKRYALKFFVPRCRDAVVAREKTKSLLIRTIHSFRLAYRHLAKLLASEGKIPDTGLVFFFTHAELNDLMTSKSVALISKAIKRRKIHPEMDALVFNELSLGIPKPIRDSQEDLVTNWYFNLLIFSVQYNFHLLVDDWSWRRSTEGNTCL